MCINISSETSKAWREAERLYYCILLGSHYGMVLHTHQHAPHIHENFQKTKENETEKKYQYEENKNKQRALLCCHLIKLPLAY